jgi:hypothetical protein
LATNIPSNWRIANIAADDALILPHSVNLPGRNFRERQRRIAVNIAKSPELSRKT